MRQRKTYLNYGTKKKGQFNIKRNQIRKYKTKDIVSIKGTQFGDIKKAKENYLETHEIIAANNRDHCKVEKK